MPQERPDCPGSHNTDKSRGKTALDYGDHYCWQALTEVLNKVPDPCLVCMCDCSEFRDCMESVRILDATWSSTRHERVAACTADSHVSESPIESSSCGW